MKLYLEKLPKVICWLLIGSIIYVLIYIFWLSDIPEWFLGASRLGELLYGLFLAYISSFIFYLLSVHIPKEKIKEDTQWFIFDKAQDIILKSRLLLCKLNCNEKTIVFTLEKTQRKSKTGYNIADMTNQTIIPQTYQELYYITPKMIQKLIDEIHNRIKYINDDTNIINALLNIENCYYMRSNSEFLYKFKTDDYFDHHEANNYLDFLKLINKFENEVDIYKPSNKITKFFDIRSI